ncbi:metal dependent phosphohydrolase [Chloroherpeton thalassium ATCC 35110]|uniref:Metal dependent phosphohydrolase n=1 Tax=Chloroherpeton thalassium (strain ATCC 35110 / GB-78) TaxID=517418 RepID=B3QTW6_CHLT3|nr:Pycsar system effector family protein [Chloroherpeton thalassium]ACF14314.1 metal dependent phosphohydrolase [Chloroherpeton thalassium ATCC 35110]
MSESNLLLKKASDSVYDLFKKKLSPDHVFHNFSHTYETVEAAKEIGSGMALSENELQILTLAAWFHDSGFVETCQGHEQKSAEFAGAFLAENGFAQEKIDQVKSCILATQLPQSPKNLLEEVLCDADMVHLGRKDYFEKCGVLRIEWERVHGKVFSEQEWLKLNIEFLTKQPYFTRYAQLAYNTRRSENLLRLYERLKELELELEEKAKKQTKKNDKKAEKKAEKKEKKTIKKAKEKDRGVERYMEVYYRTSSRNHVDFSAIVDHKANILIQTNALIISIIISLVVRKMEGFPQLIAPTFMLLLTCVVTIVFAILASRPKITTHNTTRDDITNKKANLLFFGSFINLKLDEFEWGMKEMLNDKAYYTESMIRDTYFLGKVLGKKYKFLSLSYDTFMVGLLLSVIVYIWAFTQY